MRRLLSLLFLSVFAATFSYGQALNGVVVDDATGEPLMGVSVVKPGTNIGAITNMDGEFSINVPAGTVLRVSYMGYATQNVKARQGLTVMEEEFLTYASENKWLLTDVA